MNILLSEENESLHVTVLSFFFDQLFLFFFNSQTYYYWFFEEWNQVLSLLHNPSDAVIYFMNNWRSVESIGKRLSILCGLIFLLLSRIQKEKEKEIWIDLVHQFEKQEMVVLCKPEDGMKFYEKMWQYTVEFFRSLDIPVRTLECCSGDLADLKVKSCDVEAFSPRQNKYFEVGSCSILGDAQARRLGIRMKTKNGNEYLTTLNNTVLATPRGLIAFLENNVNEDGSVNIPKVLRPYMGGKEKLVPKN